MGTMLACARAASSLESGHVDYIRFPPIRVFSELALLATPQMESSLIVIPSLAVTSGFQVPLIAQEDTNEFGSRAAQ